jgi:hypothetical protein
MSVLDSILKFLQTLFSFLSIKETQKNKEFEIINSEENIKKTEKSEEVQFRDETEELLNKIKNTKSIDEKKILLEEIRRRTSR